MAIAGDHVIVKLGAPGDLKQFASGDITSVDLGQTFDQHDVTGFGDAVHRVINGQLQSPVTLKGFLTTTAITGTHTVIQGAFAAGTKVALEVQGDPRELIGNLLTISLPSEGFCSTLRHVVTRFEEQNGLHVSLEIEHAAEAGCDPSVLPPAVGVQLLRIVQETLANVRKHAGGPTQISVRLRAEAGQLQLTVQDNGAGFDPALAGADGKRFGLQVMRQRAARIGGQLAVHSAPGQGTRVEVRVPLASDEAGVEHEDTAR